MTETARHVESTAVPTLYVAFELAKGRWRLAMTTHRRERSRHYTVTAGDLVAVLEKVERARAHWGLAPGTRTLSAYEAGRDGFWLDRCLRAQGIGNVVLDPTSIERDRRAKTVKTDRVDAERLLELLVAWDDGRRRLRVVRVPSVAEEDGRQPERELAALKRIRTGLTNRMNGLLATQGVRVSVTAATRLDVAALRTWEGAPLPPALAARLAREADDLVRLQQRITSLEQARHRTIASGTTPAARHMARLMRLQGIGENGAARLVTEFFAWRTFRNGREVAALAGLTPTPFQSGMVHHDQGISKAGNRYVRTMAVELAWCWVRLQPTSALARWYQTRFAAGSRRQRRIGIVAVARKLLIALWRYLEAGELPAGARLKVAA